MNVKAFTRVEAGRLELLVRVPLAAVKDIQFPTRGDGDTLDLPALTSMLPGAAKYWIAGAFVVSADGQALASPEVADTRISISSDQSFDSYETAIAHFHAPEPAPDEQLFWQQVWFDIRFLYSLPPGGPHLSVTPRVASLGVRVLTSLTSMAEDGRSRPVSFEGDPGAIDLDPRWSDAAGQFAARGARLVAGSADFLLLLLCLVLPFKRYRLFLPVLATFAGALALAMLLAAAGAAPHKVWFDPLIDTLATLAILLAAFANIAGRVTPRRRALFALGAGAVFGFLAAAHLMQQLQFGGDHTIVSELAFGAGVIVAAAVVVAVLVPAIAVAFSVARVGSLERVIVSALAADTAWGWMGDRWTRLRRVPLDLSFDATMLAPALGTLAVVVLFGGAIWFVNEWLKSQRFADEEVAPGQMRETAS